MRGPWSQFANQHSYVLIAGAVLVVIALISLWFRRRARLPMIGGLALVLVAIAIYLRIGPGDIRSPADLDAALRGGRPVVVEFYSNYCIACLGAKPVFDDLARELASRASFLRADFQSEAGKALAARYKIDTVPTFLVFGRDGGVLAQLDGDPGVPVPELRRAVNDASK
jgi:thiol-disulfide isomerase/thioredoxin